MSHTSTEKPSHTTVNPLPVPDLPPRVLLDLITDCNLKCPMCIVHGAEDDPRLPSFIRQSMTLEQARQILDEIMTAHPLVVPNLWSEPLLIKDFRTHVQQIKERGLTIAMNTNGLGMKEDLAQFLVDIQFDSVFFSVDATTSETLEKVRGIKRLDLIHRSVELLLRVRGEKERPRIGVSMTLQDTNRHERDAFVEFWTPLVDAVRIGEVFQAGSFPAIKAPTQRVPCPALYSTMAIHTNGNVSMCCLDGFNEMNMGNVFKDGVRGVWHGPELTRIRHLHETNQFEQIPLCKNCDRWASFQYDEEVINGLLIRRTLEYTYYNRIDKLKNWYGTLLGTHVLTDQKQDNTERDEAKAAS